MKREYELKGGPSGVALNRENTVGVFAHTHFTTNQTRSSLFDPDYLVEWAKAVRDAYGLEVEVVFTPDKPMVAVDPDPDVTSLAGIAVCPREYND